ncbi:MAG: HAD family hydrolase [Desulfobacterales bacterium]|nr:HAD family hydrolase [Desulfobacterales bacterium]
MLDKRVMENYRAPMEPLPAGLAPGGRLKGPISCLLFDIYGTLFISGAGELGVTGDVGVGERQGRGPDAIDRLLTRYEIDLPGETVRNHLHGAIRNTHLDMKKRGVDFPEVDILRIWREVLASRAPEEMETFAFEFEMIVNPVYPMPNLEKTLAAFQRAGVPMGVVSNAQFYTPHLFELFLGSPPEELGFIQELMFYSHQFGRAKPSDALFRRAVERLADLSISPESTLYTGNDMLNDMLPAKRAGFMTALFAGDRRSLRRRRDVDACKDVAPDLVITDLFQLTSWGGRGGIDLLGKTD